MGQEDGEVRAAIRFTVVAAVLGVGFVCMAAAWVSTCGGMSVDTVACGPPLRREPHTCSVGGFDRASAPIASSDQRKSGETAA